MGAKNGRYHTKSFNYILHKLGVTSFTEKYPNLQDRTVWCFVYNTFVFTVKQKCGPRNAQTCYARNYADKIVAFALYLIDTYEANAYSSVIQR